MSVIFPGTVGLEVEWEYPEPPQVVYALAQLEAYLSNTVVLAEMAKQELQLDMERKFETETDPMGRAWQELVQPESEQIGILRRGSTNAEMFHAAISEGAWDTSPVGVFFDTSALPPYWIFHEQPEGTGGQRIPQRSFIDASNEAQAAIEEMGGAWMQMGIDRTVMVASPTSGRPLAPLGTTTLIGGVARREIHDPATGRFVSTRPEFYAQ